MTIISIPHDSYPEFEIYEENKMLIHIKVDREAQAFRINYKDKRRVFFIAEEMVKKGRVIILLNEYSQRLGSLNLINSTNSSGEIEIEGVRYTYELNDDFGKEINLFRHDNSQPILSCKLEKGELSFLNKKYVNYVLFALSWFAFITTKQEAFVQTA